MSSWKDALTKTCNFIAKENPDTFQWVLEDIEAAASHKSQEGRKYFSYKYTIAKMQNPKEINETEVFVETNLSANNIKELLDVLCRYFHYLPPEITYGN